ncbi:MAG TPA: isoprenylcysteine carboxylmethyltransferase family protein [Bryobacteraceae bacterium]|nr:isoprenylcysteine carboxylmethyltransferase family protein [Bryobacteraceae bacterium]
MTWKRASLAGFITASLCLVWLFYRKAIIGTGPVTIGIQIAAVGLMFWARVTFGRRSFHATANPTEGGLVTNGPYRYLRHPIYAAALYLTWAGIAVHLSVPNALIALIATAGLAVRMRAEETLILDKYPEYADYARRTRRVMPFVF